MLDLQKLLDVAGYEVTYAVAPGTGGWFADLRNPDGRCIVSGMGATKEQAREHLAERLNRDESGTSVPDP